MVQEGKKKTSRTSEPKAAPHQAGSQGFAQFFYQLFL